MSKIISECLDGRCHLSVTNEIYSLLLLFFPSPKERILGGDGTAIFKLVLTNVPRGSAMYPVPAYTTPVPVLPADYDANNTTVSEVTVLFSLVSVLISYYIDLYADICW